MDSWTCEVEKRRLGQTDLHVSRIGFGASPFGDVYGPVDTNESIRAVHLAIDKGVNFFDVSPYYGLRRAEERLGEALKGKRKGIVLATKVGRYGLNEFDFSANRVAQSLDQSLSLLKTEWVDLLQVHDVEFGDLSQIVEETLPALRRMQQAGKARYIGITGYPPEFLVRVAKAHPVDTILNYCHYNLLADSMDQELTTFASNNGIGLINASPLHMAILTERGAPHWHPAPIEVREAARRVQELCRQWGKNIAAVAIRFCLDHPYVSSTLVGMSTPQEVEANVELLELRTDARLIAEIRAAIAPAFNIRWPSGKCQ